MSTRSGGGESAPPGRDERPSRRAGRAGWLARVLFTAALRAHPRAFRDRHDAELHRFLDDALADAGGGRLQRVLLVLRLSAGEARSGLRQRWRALRRQDEAGQPAPRSGSRPGGGGFVDVWRHDARYAARAVRRAPGFALIVVITLALGLGATTAVFGVLRSVVLAPLPFEEPDRLVRVYQPNVDAPDGREYATAPAYEHVRDHARSFDGIAAVYTYAATGADVTVGGNPERMRTLGVSDAYFDVLRIAPVAGRTFAREDGRQEPRPVIVSATAWQRLSGGASWSPGTSVMVDGASHDVIGILPAGFEDPIVGSVDIWLPLAFATEAWPSWEWDNHWLSWIARLAPGVTRDAAQRELSSLALRQAEIEPVAANFTFRLYDLQDDLLGNSDALLFLLMGAVVLLLLLASVNVASLHLARSLERAQELAVRAVLGSTHGRMARQFILEALVLALAGALAGGVLAFAASRVLLAITPVELRSGAVAVFDATVFGFGLLAAVLCGLFFGTIPAWSIWRRGLGNVLRADARTGGAHTAQRARRALTVVQVALALVLVVGAGLLLASVRQLQRVQLGVEPVNALTFEVNLPESRYADPAARTRFHEEFGRRLEGLAGVRAAGAVSWLPVTGRGFIWGTRRATSTGPLDDNFFGADQRVIVGDYFAAAGIRLLRGRAFRADDTADAPARVIINESFARTLYPDADALGAYVWISGQGMEIIGIVTDAAYGARGQVGHTVYHPHAQFAQRRNWSMKYVIANNTTRSLVHDVRTALATLDPALVMHAPESLADVVGRGNARERFAMLLLVAFAALAVLLSAIGVYGVLANAVQRRRREIGIRLALGAETGAIRAMVVRQGVSMAAIGITIGVAGALALSRLLESLLFGVSALDPRVFAIAALTVVGIAGFASWLPSRTATRIPPSSAFRAEG